MERREIRDGSGMFQAEIEVAGPVLAQALSHPHAEDVLRVSVIGALLVLTQEGPWPVAFIESTQRFMEEIGRQVHQNELH